MAQKEKKNRITGWITTIINGGIFLYKSTTTTTTTTTEKLNQKIVKSKAK